MKVIPALDILDGNVVTLKQGIFDQKTIYSDNPGSLIGEWVSLGLEAFHLVDLNGARGSGDNRTVFVKLLKEHPKARLQLGGGIRTLEQVQSWMDAGADKIVIGTAAIEDRGLLTEIKKHSDPARIIIAMDLIRGSVAYHGWEAWADIRIEEHISACYDLGFTNILSTDVGREGTLTGPNVKLYTSLREKFPNIYWIAGGGITNMDDVRSLSKTGVRAAIVGKAIYERQIDPVQIRDWNISPEVLQNG